MSLYYDTHIHANHRNAEVLREAEHERLVRELVAIRPTKEATEARFERQSRPFLLRLIARLA